MTGLADNQLELLRALARHGVEFVVVGGVAAQLHGWDGATVDLDIAVSTDESNVERLNRALLSVAAGPPVIGALGSVFQTRFGRLEVVRRADGIGDYAAWAQNAGEHVVDEQLTVVVAAPADILRSKEAAGRAKDHAALPAMRDAFRNSGA